ncbi:MAG: response regulator, partial [Sulfurospirillaceae bacterium]|nr:response regulator [Sulfurospirillaceae bacterium]
MLQSKKTILIVDDTESNIDMLLAILKEYDTVVATSGEDALMILEQEAIDLVLLDIIMPGIDGFEVCRRIKQNPEWHN